VTNSDWWRAPDLGRAREVLGVSEQSTMAEVRSTYRARLRKVHPDQNSSISAAEETKELIAAFRVVSEVHSQPHFGFDVAAAPAAPGPEARNGTEVRNGASGGGDAGDSENTGDTNDSLDVNAFASLVDDDTVAIESTGTEAFAALVAVGHEIGDVTYIDRQNELLEILLRTVTNDTLSLVATLQGRANGTTEAFLTLEPLDVGVTELPTIRGVALLVIHHLNYRHAFT
jgi:hypothetical protein